MNNNTDIARRKFEMLMRAFEQAHHQDDAMDELRDAAFEVLLLHPGCDLDMWGEILAEQYGTELIDAFGEDLDKITTGVIKLWHTPYHDDNSGLKRTFAQWAEAFSTEESVQLYYELTRKNSKKT